MTMKKTMMAGLLFVAGAAMPCGAEVVAVSPANGETVAMLPECQRRVMALETQEERRALFADDAAHGKALAHDKLWRKSAPLVLEWKATDGDAGPWAVEISTSPDFSGARVEIVDRKGTECKWEVPRPNLVPATRYWWRVTANAACKAWSHGRVCKCKNRRQPAVSAPAEFVTADVAPRWIEIEGRVSNIRDVGGRKTVDGRRVRTGLAFRGQGLNDNSTDGIQRGRNRLMVEDVSFLRGTLGIKTDLDLRNAREVAGMEESPLGPGVRYVWHSSECYAGAFKPKGMDVMAKNFRVLCNRGNLPVYFHCIAGADRTGTLAYILGGLLGVPEHDLETDWESTFYPKIPGAKGRDDWNWIGHIREGLAKYGKPGDPLSLRVELYLKDCGITDAEIASAREIYLEK